jgi:hypothetical protein
MEAAERCPDALVLEAEAAKRSAFTAQRLETLQKPDEALLAMGEQIEKLALAALRHERNRT